MIELPTWHIERAKSSLEYFYTRWEKLMLFADAATKTCNSKFNRLWANKYRQAALENKASGIVWHDRYMLLLDCRRSWSSKS